MSIAFVGEAFGAEEEKVGRPFVGRSGQLLNQALGELGLSRDGVLVTNVCMFRPTDSEGRNRPPTPKEIQDNVDECVKRIANCTHIVYLGATAHRALSVFRGLPLSTMLGKRVLSGYTTSVSVWHPAYVLRNPAKYDEWVAQMRNALEDT